MGMHCWEITSENELNDVASQCLQVFPNERMFAFQAPMGAGKTTFIKALCKQLQVVDVVCSPTFAIVNEYKTVSGEPVYHFDFYRINKISEVFDIGYEDYFYSNAYCFLEWTENITPLLPERYVQITINVKPGGERVICAQVVDERRNAWT